MARSEIPMVINLRQNKNDESTAYGKYFAECDAKEPLNLKGFAAHMTSHGKIADYQMCVLVLGQVVDCMKELLTQGQPVKLDGFGTEGAADAGSAREAGWLRHVLSRSGRSEAGQGEPRRGGGRWP